MDYNFHWDSTCVFLCFFFPWTYANVYLFEIRRLQNNLSWKTALKVIKFSSLLKAEPTSLLGQIANGAHVVKYSSMISARSAKSKWTGTLVKISLRLCHKLYVQPTWGLKPILTEVHGKTPTNSSELWISPFVSLLYLCEEKRQWTIG